MESNHHVEFIPNWIYFHSNQLLKVHDTQSCLHNQWLTKCLKFQRYRHENKISVYLLPNCSLFLYAVVNHIKLITRKHAITFISISKTPMLQWNVEMNSTVYEPIHSNCDSKGVFVTFVDTPHGMTISEINRSKTVIIADTGKFTHSCLFHFICSFQYITYNGISITEVD